MWVEWEGKAGGGKWQEGEEGNGRKGHLDVVQLSVQRRHALFDLHHHLFHALVLLARALQPAPRRLAVAGQAVHLQGAASG